MRSEFERLLGCAVFELWSDLPREVQEKLFESAVAANAPFMRSGLAVLLHEHHPRTAHPPKPTQLV